MGASFRPQVWTVLAVVFLLLLPGCGKRVAKKDLPLPSLMLWAWDRPENLQFIDASTTGVAYLAGTADILLDGVVRVHMREETLQVPPHTTLLPVIRIQSRRGHAAADTDALVAVVRRAAMVDGGHRVQIDFDARLSEQTSYRHILAQLSGELVSVTALASWCENSSWLQSAPVNEAVPMLFRMGGAVATSEHVQIRSGECQTSLGLSIDEQWPAHRPGTVHRLYVFDPHAWNAQDYSAVRKRIGEWK